MEISQEFEDTYRSFTIRRLCEVIISARYLGILEQECILCMQELAARREQGEQFDYETFIETEIKKLPNFKIDLEKSMRFTPSMLRNIK